jgi:hypothetical protein
VIPKPPINGQNRQPGYSDHDVSFLLKFTLCEKTFAECVMVCMSALMIAKADSGLAWAVSGHCGVLWQRRVTF